MLDVLRTNAKSAFTWLIVIGIVVVFAINFGPGSLSQSGCGGAAPPYAAKVNGRILPASDWERQYRQLYQLFQQQAGEGFTRELADQLGLPAQAMEQIVDRELVVQEAKRRGVTITSQELSRAVHAIPAFQENGVFRFEIYEENARAQTWRTTMSDPDPGNPSASPGISDVHSGSEQTGLEGEPYAEW
jgi:peptidyl-prolyl cis-trans isomerase D